MATATLEPELDFDLPKGFEMVDGHLVEMPAMGSEASWVASEVHSRLRAYLEHERIGIAATAECSFKCFPDLPELVHKPDVSVILCDPTTYQPPRVNSEVPPDLLVEVLARQRDERHDPQG